MHIDYECSGYVALPSASSPNFNRMSSSRKVEVGQDREMDTNGLNGSGSGIGGSGISGIGGMGSGSGSGSVEMNDVGGGESDMNEIRSDRCSSASSLRLSVYGGPPPQPPQPQLTSSSSSSSSLSSSQAQQQIQKQPGSQAPPQAPVPVPVPRAAMSVSVSAGPPPPPPPPSSQGRLSPLFPRKTQSHGPSHVTGSAQGAQAQLPLAPVLVARPPLHSTTVPHKQPKMYGVRPPIHTMQSDGAAARAGLPPSNAEDDDAAAHLQVVIDRLPHYQPQSDKDDLT